MTTVAGEGTADWLMPGLAIDAAEGPDPEQLEGSLATADVVVVENLLSLPLNPAAGRAVADVLRGRPAVVRHHDLPWEHTRFAAWDEPVPTDSRWRHAVLSDQAGRQLMKRGVTAVVIRNRFNVDPPAGRRAATRAALGVSDGATLAVQPTRAIPRKEVAAGIALARELGATYWITGAAELGFDDELAALLEGAGTPAIHGWPEGTDPDRIEDAYAAADFILLPSSWEGFGNPAIESAIHRRPLAIGRYPVAAELRALGFEWFDLDDVARMRRFLSQPDDRLLEANRAVAARHFNLIDLPAELDALLADLVG